MDVQKPEVQLNIPGQNPTGSAGSLVAKFAPKLTVEFPKETPIDEETKAIMRFSKFNPDNPVDIERWNALMPAVKTALTEKYYKTHTKKPASETEGAFHNAMVKAGELDQKMRDAIDNPLVDFNKNPELEVKALEIIAKREKLDEIGRARLEEAQIKILAKNCPAMKDGQPVSEEEKIKKIKEIRQKERAILKLKPDEIISPEDELKALRIMAKFKQLDAIGRFALEYMEISSKVDRNPASASTVFRAETIKSATKLRQMAREELGLQADAVLLPDDELKALRRLGEKGKLNDYGKIELENAEVENIASSIHFTLNREELSQHEKVVKLQQVRKQAREALGLQPDDILTPEDELKALRNLAKNGKLGSFGRCELERVEVAKKASSYDVEINGKKLSYQEKVKALTKLRQKEREIYNLKPNDFLSVEQETVALRNLAERGDLDEIGRMELEQSEIEAAIQRFDKKNSWKNIPREDKVESMSNLRKRVREVLGLQPDDVIFLSDYDKALTILNQKGELDQVGKSEFQYIQRLPFKDALNNVAERKAHELEAQIRQELGIAPGRPLTRRQRLEGLRRLEAKGMLDGRGKRALREEEIYDQSTTDKAKTEDDKGTKTMIEVFGKDMFETTETGDSQEAVDVDKPIKPAFKDWIHNASEEEIKSKCQELSHSEKMQLAEMIQKAVRDKTLSREDASKFKEALGLHLDAILEAKEEENGLTTQERELHSIVTAINAANGLMKQAVAKKRVQSAATIYTTEQLAFLYHQIQSTNNSEFTDYLKQIISGRDDYNEIMNMVSSYAEKAKKTAPAEAEAETVTRRSSAQEDSTSYSDETEEVYYIAVEDVPDNTTVQQAQNTDDSLTQLNLQTETDQQKLVEILSRDSSVLGKLDQQLKKAVLEVYCRRVDGAQIFKLFKKTPSIYQDLLKYAGEKLNIYKEDMFKILFGQSAEGMDKLSKELGINLTTFAKHNKEYATKIAIATKDVDFANEILKNAALYGLQMGSSEYFELQSLVNKKNEDIAQGEMPVYNEVRAEDVISKITFKA